MDGNDVEGGIGSRGVGVNWARVGVREVETGMGRERLWMKVHTIRWKS